MAQITTDPILLLQINAGTKGRRKGHSYENELASKINSTIMPYTKSSETCDIVQKGSPVNILLDKILNFLGWSKIDKIEAYATGKLATLEKSNKEILIDGKSITSAKSDVILTLHNSNTKRIIGVSIKQCNNKTPTNARALKK